MKQVHYPDMRSVCLTTKCYRCCMNTNMLLSHHDVKTIEGLGYPKDFFLIQKNGWLQLKNNQGRCVFHTTEQCCIYDHRPEGCKLYPIVYQNDTSQIMLDNDCPQRHQFELTETAKQQLIRLLEHLQQERMQRKRVGRNL